MKIIATILCLGLVVGCALFPQTGKPDPDALVAILTNADIRWDGTDLGLHPFVEGRPANKLLGLGKLASPALRKALSDPNKFVAAHVLLTQIEKKKYQISASRWNNLSVNLHADGTVNYLPEQITKIMAMWK